MVCFIHRSAQAIGLCKHCSKGVCAECLVETQWGCACSEACGAEIARIYAHIDRGSSAWKRLGPTYFRTAILYLLFGVVSLVGTAILAIAHDPVAFFCGAISAIFILGAGFYLSIGLKYRSNGPK